MKQVFQSLQSGNVCVLTCPVPMNVPGKVIINTSHSLLSVGTEKMLIEFGKANYLQKAIQQPEKVKSVLEKISTDGMLSTFDAVRSKLHEPLALGYCNVGMVSAVGKGVSRFRVGQRVVSNGPHADVVSVNENLCCVVPDGVESEDAAFTVLASVGLQGIRLANPTLGETFVVIGAGLIGLLTVQLLLSNGCKVLVVDMNSARLKIAKDLGAETCDISIGQDPIEKGMDFSRGLGVDGVLITASTKSSDPVSQAARMSRKRGRIVLVGVTGLQLNRAEFYEKEITFQVSCSYGPGRYDKNYEEKGNDYPFGLVRWTERRNFEAVLDLMASGKLSVKPLITHNFDFDQVEEAYNVLSGDPGSLGILLNYNSDISSRHIAYVSLNNSNFIPGRTSVGIIGAGNYASRIIIPALNKSGANLSKIVTSTGSSGVIHGENAGFAEATTDLHRLLSDVDTSAVVIVTRHNSHARFVIEALESGKHVFVEKPLALTLDELEQVRQAWLSQNKKRTTHLMVGFNRRFSPQIQKIKELLRSVCDPKSIIMTMNAGSIPLDHWTQDKEVGGGRIVGEACHYIDLMRYLVGASIVSIQALGAGGRAKVLDGQDNASILIGFEDGSFGTVNYFSNGPASFPKERVEIFTSGKVIQLDNFRKMRGFGWSGFRKYNLWRQDKGQYNCIKAFVDAVQNGSQCPIPPDEIFEVAKVSIEAAVQISNQ